MGTGYDYVVVVGVDGSDASLRALAWAAERAVEQGGIVLAVTAWRSDLPDAGLRDNHHGQLGPKQRAVAVLARAVEAVACPVPVAGEVVEGRAADILRAASRDADLLVLGSHGRTRLFRPVLGQVAAECASTAYCPVVVVPLTQPSDSEVAEQLVSQQT